MDNDL